MKADRIEVSWNGEKKYWDVRIQAGEEVLRRHCNLSKDTDDGALRDSALQTAKDDGYQTDATEITIRR